MNISRSASHTSLNLISEQELSECDREKLHLLGGIQGGAGHVIFFHNPNGKIVAVDTSIYSIPWIKDPEKKDDSTAAEAEHIIGTHLQAMIPDDLYGTIFESIRDMMVACSRRTFLFTKQCGGSYAISLSSTMEDCSLIGMEIEEVDDEDETATFHTTLVHLGRIMEFDAKDKIAETACDTVFTLFRKYDRGMVYRFNDDLSGEVIHEIKNDSLDSSYMGMRFPASDIPLPARELYIKNGLRYIHDVDAKDNPLISIQSMEIDLTQCRMRAVAKPHVVYLRNMGVVSSLSLAIVVDNELWGLLAFHAYDKPFKPSLHQRIACETVTSMLSVRIEALLRKIQSNRLINLGDILMRWKPEKSAVHNLFNLGEKILEVVDADVLVACIEDPRKNEGDSLVVGDVSLAPKDHFWERFKTHPSRELCTCSTRAAIEAMELTQEDCPASGFVYFREGRTQIMLGRSLRSTDVVWAGDPDAPKLRIGGILNPRASFNQFMEKAKKESRSWTESDLNAIRVFRDHVCQHSHQWIMSLLKTDIDEANQKYMNALDRAQDNYEFFAHMSHELRTPFHGVMGCLNILNDSFMELSPKEVSDLVNTALASGNHMLSLLNEILKISKDKHLAHKAVQEEAIYQSLAFEAVDGLKSLAVNKSIDFKCEITPNQDKVVILTDRTKIIQIVSNILNNAIKFVGEGSIEVRFHLLDELQDAVSLWKSEASTYEGVAFTMEEGKMFTSIDEVQQFTSSRSLGDGMKWMLVCVKDTGCGMKADELTAMFEPYTQSSNGSNRVFQGTGLGLFICVSLCQQLHGFIACSSTKDVGTAFHVCVPVGVGSPSSTGGSLPATPDEKVEDKHIPIRGPVLIADDNKVNLKVLHRAFTMELKKAGLDIEVTTTNGGSEAIRLYKEMRPSLVIIDYHMPEIDGIAAMKALREVESDLKLPASYIMSYTADVTEQATELLRRSGANEIMEKPPPKGFIANLVRRLEIVSGTPPGL
jgi:light-regulated signal transduction histidine kinase (bacteriophytochrome)